MVQFRTQPATPLFLYLQLNSVTAACLKENVHCYCRDFGPDSIARKDNQLLFFQTHSWGTIPFARAYLKIPPALTISATLPRDFIGYSLFLVIFFMFCLLLSIST